MSAPPEKLSAIDALVYFTEKDSWKVMLSGIRDISESDYLRLQYAKDLYDLHKMAFEMGLYTKQCGDITMEE